MEQSNRGGAEPAQELADGGFGGATRRRISLSDISQVLPHGLCHFGSKSPDKHTTVSTGMCRRKNKVLKYNFLTNGPLKLNCILESRSDFSDTIPYSVEECS